MGTVPPALQPVRRTEIVASLVDKQTLRDFDKLVRRWKSTRSAVLYHLIQAAIEAEEAKSA